MGQSDYFGYIWDYETLEMHELDISKGILFLF